MPVRPLVLCGPSGVGKSTLLKKLMAEFQDYFGFSVSHTTRSPRSGEQNGVHYHFVSKEDMRTAIQNGEFLETAEYSGNLYGTSKKAVEDVAKKNKICVLDIDMQGVVLIKETDLDPLYVFIQPPSIQDLEDRLTQRGTETTESLAKRLSAATEEINFGLTPGNFDFIITNDDAEQAYQRLRRFVLPLVESLKDPNSD